MDKDSVKAIVANEYLATGGSVTSGTESKVKIVSSLQHARYLRWCKHVVKETYTVGWVDSSLQLLNQSEYIDLQITYFHTP